MAMLGNIPRMDALGAFSARFVLAARLLELGAQADAYLLFSALAREQPYHVAVNYNLALCCAAAGHWEPCLSRLERALDELAPRGIDPHPRDATYHALVSRQCAGRSYLFPLPEEAPLMAPDYTRECVLRLIIDGCAALRLPDQFDLAFGRLLHRDYANVQKARALFNE